MSKQSIIVNTLHAFATPETRPGFFHVVADDGIATAFDNLFAAIERRQPRDMQPSVWSLAKRVETADRIRLALKDETLRHLFWEWQEAEGVHAECRQEAAYLLGVAVGQHAERCRQ